MFKWFRRKRHLQEMTSCETLIAIREQVERMNIPVVADDFDAGYDMAVDEVLVLIDRLLDPQTSDDVTYGDDE